MAQLVKLEPGDILVLANLGPLHDPYEDEESGAACWLAELKELLQLNCILVFEGDVDLSSLPAGKRIMKGLDWLRARVTAVVRIGHAKPAVPRLADVQSCRSEEGITVGLVDAIIGILRVLAPRDLRTENVQEALTDLFEDPDFRTVRSAQTETSGEAD